MTDDMQGLIDDLREETEIVAACGRELASLLKLASDKIEGLCINERHQEEQIGTLTIWRQASFRSKDKADRLEAELTEAKGVGAGNLQRAARLYSELQIERDKWKRDAYAWAPAGTRKGWDREAKESDAAARRYPGTEGGCGQVWVWDNSLIGRCGEHGSCGDCAPTHTPGEG